MVHAGIIGRFCRTSLQQTRNGTALGEIKCQITPIDSMLDDALNGQARTRTLWSIVTPAGTDLRVNDELASPTTANTMPVVIKSKLPTTGFNKYLGEQSGVSRG